MVGYFHNHRLIHPSFGHCWLMRKFGRLFLTLAIVSCIFVTNPISAAAKSPYTILGVSPSASRQEIQKAYRQQCLRLHPDKNTNRSPKERAQCEALFKEVQEAYSIIGDDQGRRSFDLHEQYGAFSGNAYSQPSSTSGDYSRFFQERRTTGDPTMDAFFRAFAQSGPSVYFARGPEGRPRFGVRRTFPSGPADFVPSANGLSFRSIYKQKVKVPLEKLYTGTEIEFHVVDNIWIRWRGAIRGKIVFLLFYQGLLYSIPLFRTSKVLACIVCLFITHINLPQPDPMQSFLSTLPKGTTQTSVVFQQKRSDQPEVIFEIYEAPHKRYRREGDNLRTFVKITRREAEAGCTKEIPSLDPDQSPITISIPPNTVNRMELCIHGKGWPTGTAETYGDLFVRVDIKEDRGLKRGKHKKKR
jgi:DnaJ-class molecular chaperone